MSQTSSTSQLFGQLSEFMEEIQAEKTASHDKDPGGHDGPSTHPSADVDDSLADASEGARSSENSSDVKADVETDGVDGHAEAKPGDGEDNQYNIGLSQSATGEEPSVEDDFKGDKDDPGTAHVADTSDGEKYGSLEEKYAAASFAEARNHALNLGNEILASLANGVDMSKQAAEQAVTTETPTTTTEATTMETTLDADPETKQAAEAGYALAAALGMEKLSSEERVSASIEQTIKDAQLDADLVGGYLTDLAAGLEDQEKTAEGMLPDEMEDPTGGAAEGDIEGEPSGMEEGGDLGEELGGEMGGLPEELLGGGGEEPLGGGEGLGEEDVAAALGGLEEPEAGIGEEEALQELAMALDELGIEPEELAAAASEEGGLPKEVVAECKKLASAV